MPLKLTKLSVYAFILFVIILFILTLQKYPGNWLIYTLFTLALNTLFLSGFRKNKIFFDSFIGVFFWVGFWLKLSMRVAFFNGKFVDPVGLFNASAEHYDKALLATTCGVLAFLLASFIREKFIFTYKSIRIPKPHTATENFYIKYKPVVLSLFVLAYLIIGATNAYFGVYQRGQAPRITLPFGLSGIYTWLLFFGFTSISAVLLNIELKLSKSPYVVAIIALLETALSNISMLSRGMIINASTLFYGLIEEAKKRGILLNLKFQITIAILFGVLFVSSIIGVNYVRTLLYLPVTITDSTNLSDPILAAKIKESQELLKYARTSENLIQSSAPLFIDRIVGIEGMLAISNHPNLGWDLFQTALNEKYQLSGTSFYDLNIAVTSPYRTMTNDLNHFISLPGILAFMFYPGSFLFLFGMSLLLSFLASGIEFLSFKLSAGNLIFCAIMAQMVTYRYVHFGYVPKQSYLLFGTILANILIIYLVEKVLKYFDLRKRNKA